MVVAERGLPKNKVPSLKRLFDITGRVAIITGGAGFLGVKHAEAIAEGGGIPVLVDKDKQAMEKKLKYLREEFGASKTHGIVADITKPSAVQGVLKQVLQNFGRVDILINNAANNPRMEEQKDVQWTKFENFPLNTWNDDIEVGLTGAFLCSQIIGGEMARKGKGVVINIASDFGVIAPDHRVYKLKGMTEETQPYKPPTYSVVKSGLIHFTKYLGVYWAKKGVRVNAITPGGVFNNQDPEFVKNNSELIPMGRMCGENELKGAVLFLASDASSYMTGANLIIDGGRTSW